MIRISPIKIHFKICLIEASIENKNKKKQINKIFFKKKRQKKIKFFYKFSKCW